MKFLVSTRVRNWRQIGRVPVPVIMTLLFAGVVPPLLAEGEYNHHHHVPAEAHVHGEAELNIVIDGAQVLVEFLSPMENLLGFEHGPETAEQKQAVEDLEQHLADYRALFFITDAQCEQIEQHNEDPFAEEYMTHAEWHGEYRLSCNEFDNATSLRPQLFSSYPGVEKLTIQMISAHGQSQFVVTKDSELIPLQ